MAKKSEDKPAKSAKKKSTGPKKPLKGYMLFAQEHRDEVKKKHPDLTFGGIGKKMGEMWRGLSDAEKEAYKAGNGKK